MSSQNPDISMEKRTRDWIGDYAPYLILGVFVVWTLVPILWMIISSFKLRTGMFEMPPTIIFEPTMQYYEELFFGSNPLTPYLINSVMVSIASAVVAVGLGTLGGYGLSRLQIRGKKHLAFWIISTRMAPIAVVIVPLYFIYQYAGLLNTHLGLVIAYTTFNLPFAIWLMRSFFDEIPVAIEDAARIDGATRWQAFYKVAVPLVLPGMGATAIISIVYAWNDFMFALIFTNSTTQTIPVAASQLVTQTGTHWGQLMAVGVVILAPMVIFGLIVKNYLVSGLTMGAMKQ
ncbi:carbohydrate ABC transporter permease [Halorubellus sp. PRR65]|uniref:carbohydrate ABC transporter permease n=1 Tax=Halorubellus sp. PRR65 TaxID=3098148 RepID=UPI002B25C5CD|nr:carbohydrate ABC transporter permease [Halorubellus sp. PRR65]